MHLRRVEIQGFKAFADRQHFEFGPGITIISGPNGSGKSNVHDAIRWALGEQPTRQIRARKTEDVIFSGSDQRRQLGSAEVSLVLDNSDGWMPVDFSEVTVTRRAYRSGENEYLINGQRVRLTDVLDLFRRAQVGQNSYAMMSQGLVDEVLAMRPQERRELIEEAADVRRHRQQVVLSERRLTETRDNLGHVRTLIRELEPRLRQLERQTKKAQRFEDLQARLREALCVYFEQELRTANDALVAARARHDQRTQDFSQARSAADRLDARLAELEAVAAERRRALEELQTNERRLSEEGLALEQQVALAEQRLELLGRRRTDVEAELGAATSEPQDRDGDGDRLATLELRAAEARTAIEREREALRSADGAARAALRELAGAEAKRARLEAELADAERRVEEHERRRRERAVERAAAEARRAELLDQLRALGLRSLELERRGAALEQAAAEARRRRDEAEARLEAQLRALIETRDGARLAEARASVQRERLEMLRELAAGLTADGDGGRALLAAAAEPGADEPPLEGIVGTIGELIRVPEGLEVAIEAALAGQLSAIVVQHEEDAIAAIAYLREQEAGTATLLPLDSVAHNYPLNLFNERGVIGVAARLARTEQQYRPLIDTLLGRTIVVDDLETARRMIRRGLGAVVTRDGVLLRPGGAYYGGQAGAGAQRFAIQGEIESLPAHIDEAQRHAETQRAGVERAEAEVVAARDAVERAREGVDEAEAARRSHDGQLAGLRREQSSLSAEMRLVRQSLERDADGDAATAAAGRRDELARAQQSVEGEITTLRDGSEAVVVERDTVAERVTTAAANLALAEGAHRVESEQRQERSEARRRARARTTQLQSQVEQARREIEDLELSLRELREQAVNGRSTLALAQAAIGPAHAALAEATEEQRERSASRGDVQARLLAAERASLQADSELRECGSRLQALTQQLTEEGLAVVDGTVRLAAERSAGDAADEDASADGAAADGAAEDGAAADGAAEDGASADGRAAENGTSADGTSADGAAAQSQSAPAPVRGGAEVAPAMLRDRISELRGEMRALGAVNVEAPEDLGEERERHDFLVGQVGDLESAEEELRAAIGELRKLIRVRFAETFEQVNTAFGEYFRRFFGGGSAEMTLVEADEQPDEEPDEEPADDPGVEITAQPPGKRIASLTVLSGGERALTSVALLFALLSVNPAPICVLDEVDAALDEANVGRFVETLRELCEHSQFIVVTHSRRTMEAADTIYGVSMGEDSVSRVLSLKLADLPQAS